MTTRLEKCSECDMVYVRDSNTGKFHPRYKAEQICNGCHADFQRGLMREHMGQFWSLQFSPLRPRVTNGHGQSTKPEK